MIYGVRVPKYVYPHSNPKALCMLLNMKMDFSDVIKLNILRWGIILATWAGPLNGITCPYKREEEENLATEEKTV